MHRRSWRPLAAATILALATLTACSGNNGGATTRPTEIDLQQEITSLKARLVEMEKRAIVGEVESARLRRRVHDLEEQLATTGRYPGSATPAPTAASGSTAPPTASPTPPAERPDTTAAVPTEDLASEPSPGLADSIEVEDLEDQLPLPSNQTPPAVPSPDAETVVAGSTSETPPNDLPPTEQQEAASTGGAIPPDDATFAAYDSAYVLFHEKRYRAAEEKFADFVARYPNSELTDNAQFWIGECRYARKDFGGALEAFSATVANYPGGNKVPDALLKAGKSLEALGRPDQARQTYLEIRRRFPQTAVALAAQEQLAELD